MLTAIAAVSENNIIGKNQKLLWHLPNDLKRFKQLTKGHAIIMGRKTFESLPGILPYRKHIIITRQRGYHPGESWICSSMKEAINLASDDEQPFIIGGGEVYALAWEKIQKIELTRVHQHFNGDTHFPDINLNDWKLIYSKYYKKDERHAFNFSFKTYIRK